MAVVRWIFLTPVSQCCCQVYACESLSSVDGLVGVTLNSSPCSTRSVHCLLCGDIPAVHAVVIRDLPATNTEGVWSSTSSYCPAYPNTPVRRIHPPTHPH